MKKLNLILLVLIIVLGVFVLFKQLPFGKNGSDDPPVSVDEEGYETDYDSGYEETRSVGLSEPVENLKISEYDLHNQVKNKRYLENTFMALEYSKVNTQQLVDTVENYLDDNTTMKPEDVAELIRINEKTFLNRYLKVFVSAPEEDLTELNNEMRRIFYQMKVGFDTLVRYGSAPIVPSHGEGEGSGYEEGMEDLDGEIPMDGEAEDAPIQDHSPTSTTNIAREEKRERVPVFDDNDLRSGIQQLKSAMDLVDDAIKLLGVEDIKIEQAWLEAGISEGDILEVMDKTNIVNPNLSEDTEFGEEEELNRGERLEDTQNNN